MSSAACAGRPRPSPRPYVEIVRWIFPRKRLIRPPDIQRFPHNKGTSSFYDIIIITIPSYKQHGNAQTLLFTRSARNTHRERHVITVKWSHTRSSVPIMRIFLYIYIFIRTRTRSKDFGTKKKTCLWREAHGM